MESDNRNETEAALQEARGHHQAGRLSEAVEIYTEVLKARPEDASVVSKLGAALAGQGQLKEAFAHLQGALDIDGELVEAHNNIGIVYRMAGNAEAAIVAFRQAVKLDPDFIMAHVNLGNTLIEEGDQDGAVACFRRAVAIDPDMPDAHSGLGAALQRMRKWDEAAEACRRALEIDPEHAHAHNNLGNVLKNQDRLEEATRSFGRALATDPGLVAAHTNLGNTLKGQCKLDEAMVSFQRALEIDPNNADTHWNYSQALLLTGRLAEGWAEYEWRKKCKEFRLLQWKYARPVWDGAPLDGRTILLYTEQGLGDAIQFVRYVPMVAQAGSGRIIVKCQRQLTRLFQSIPEIDTVTTDGDGDGVDFDIHAPLLSLPHVFGTDLGTIPQDVPYLDPPAKDLGGLDEAGGLKIGISWAGSPAHKNDRNRSMDLDHFKAIIDREGCAVYSLQTDKRSEDIIGMSFVGKIIDLGRELGDFTATASAIRQLDLVITVDTAVAHLAGALGKPVWTLLPFAPDWRWMLDREDTPWYPTMRLFRQKTPGDWTGVIAGVAAALDELL